MKWLSFSALMWLAGWPALAQVVPVANEGNSSLNLPLNGPPCRFQQVYSAEYLNLLWPSGGWVTGIYFRVDGRGNSFADRMFSNIQINFSTSSFGSDGLSPIFADNVGPNDQICRSGPLIISGVDFGGDGPNFFDIGIPLTSPFFYDPHQGNLLLDVRNFSGGITSPFDAENLPGDPVSSVSSLGVDSSMGTVSSSGLVTFFRFTPVPEPGTWQMIGLGLLGLALWRIRCRKRV